MKALTSVPIARQRHPGLWVAPLLPLCACGLSDAINQELRAKESAIEAQVIDQALRHSDLLISDIAAAVPQALPASARCQTLAASSCQICYREDTTGLSLSLTTPGCSLPAPAQGAELGLRLQLASLALAARYNADGVALLSGEGRLDVGASLPLFGSYQAVVRSLIEQGQVDPRTGAVQIQLLLTYTSGASSPVAIRISASGTRAAIRGAATGPNLSCQLGGALHAPTVSCR